jgi:Rad3-related DNA helicase
MNPMTAKIAINIINRRAATILKLFGEYSPEYKEMLDLISDFDFRFNKDGAIQLSNNKINRKLYRKLVPWAKRIQKKHVKVLERQAKKRREEWQKFVDDETPENAEPVFDDFDTYMKWYEQFDTHYESCYAIASMEGYDGKDLYIRADQLNADYNAYVDAWNNLYKHGSFSAYMEQYEKSTDEEQYKVDELTGESTINYEDWNDIEYD